MRGQQVPYDNPGLNLIKENVMNNTKKRKGQGHMLLVFLICFFNISSKGNNTMDSLPDAEVVYYVDSEEGNDNYAGTSRDYPFASLEKINQAELKPGTTILFKSGTVYDGQLKPRGAGVPGRPVIISKYGGGERPLIRGNGQYPAAVYLYNSQYIELRGLEITNTGIDLQPGRRGVIIEAENMGVSRHIVLDDLYIHDVNGSMIKQKGGGSAILWINHGNEVKTRFDSLIIENCHIKNCTRNAINSRGYTNRSRWFPSTNIIIRKNLIEGVPGDGIVPIGTDGTIIEYNVMRDSPDILPVGEAAAGIWPWSSDNTIIQFNEVSGHKAKWDGQGFDADWNCLNTLIQFNYSHDNYGGFLLVCNNGENYTSPYNAGTVNTVIRYNISVNDGIRPYETKRKGWFSPILHLTGPVENTAVYKNIFIVPEKQKPEVDRTVVQMDNWGGPFPRNSVFYHNYFLLHEEGKNHLGLAENTFFSGNNFVKHNFGLLNQEENTIPDWAFAFMEKIDQKYKEKLIHTFFTEEKEIRQLLLSLD